MTRLAGMPLRMPLEEWRRIHIGEKRMKPDFHYVLERLSLLLEEEMVRVGRTLTQHEPGDDFGHGIMEGLNRAKIAISAAWYIIPHEESQNPMAPKGTTDDNASKKTEG